MNPSEPSVKRWLVRAAVVAVLLVAVAIGVCVYLGVSTSLHAEKALHAINLVTVVVDRFIQQEQRWPNSWDDLQCVKTADAPSMFSWPDDAETVQEFVTIDFDADVKMIASQTVDEFDAIKPIGSSYPYKHYGYVDSLIKSTKVMVARALPATAPIVFLSAEEFTDGGTIYVKLRDASGKVITFCVTADYAPNRIYADTFHPTEPNARLVAIDSIEESRLIVFLRSRWLHT